MQVETSEVQISDFDYDTITCMLQYMYGCLELTAHNLRHLKVRLDNVARHMFYVCFMLPVSCILLYVERRLSVCYAHTCLHPKMVLTYSVVLAPGMPEHLAC